MSPLEMTVRLFGPLFAIGLSGLIICSIGIWLENRKGREK